MVSKKGYIKTLEAVIAIIIIVVISYTLIAQPTETPPDVPSIVKGAQKIIDQTIQFNETIRSLITKKELPPPQSPGREELLKGVQAIIDKQSPLGYDYTCAICSEPGKCLEYTPLDKNVYMTDVLIASSEEQQNVRIVRIWFWRKPTTEQEQSKIFAYNSCTTK